MARLTNDEERERRTMKFDDIEIIRQASVVVAVVVVVIIIIGHTHRLTLTQTANKWSPIAGRCVHSPGYCNRNC